MKTCGQPSGVRERSEQAVAHAFERVEGDGGVSATVPPLMGHLLKHCVDFNSNTIAGRM